LTHLDGGHFVLNADRIETVEARPDTVITTIEGKHFVVRESVEQVVDGVIRYRRAIVPAPEQARPSGKTDR
jgi:flagellar protein FlbD